MRLPWLVGLIVGTSIAAAHAGPDPQVESPAALVVVIDRALPVDKLDTVTLALGDALGELEPGQELGVVAAGTTARSVVRCGPIDDARTIAARVRSIRPTRKSKLLAALRKGGAELARAESHQRTLLVITDGDDLLTLEPTMKSLRDKGITVSTLGLESLSRITLGDIAKRGNGQVYLVENRKQVTDAIVEAAIPAEFRPLEVMILIDRSASTRGPALEAAKEIARATAEMLAPSDQVGVIAFDTEAHELVPLTRAANRTRISADIARLTSGGMGANVVLALQAAQAALVAHTPGSKHVIVIMGSAAPSDGVAELVDAMHAAKVTVSAVGLKGADRGLLSLIADHGDGRLYTIDDIGQLPKLFLHPLHPH
jgi:secreted protein with Ig-like and vWFA domain